MIVLIMILGLTVMTACTTGEQNDSQRASENRANHTFANPIEEAHNRAEWQQKGAFKTNITINMGGQQVIDAALFVETNGPGILLEISEDTVAIFDGKQMYAMPSDSAVTPFQLKTWAYFLEAPYKLNDPGTVMEEQAAAQMKGNTYDRARLTFEPGTGDTPDDWYILYRSQQNNRLRAMAYIVTAGKSVEEANQNPHAISYENFQTFENVPVATEWKFWGWSEEQGFSDEPIGEATLTDIEFLESGTLFEAPEEAQRMKRPDS